MERLKPGLNHLVQLVELRTGHSSGLIVYETLKKKKKKLIKCVLKIWVVLLAMIGYCIWREKKCRLVKNEYRDKNIM